MISRWRNKDKKGSSSILPLNYNNSNDNDSFNLSPSLSSKGSPMSLPYRPYSSSSSSSYNYNNINTTQYNYKHSRVPGHIRPINLNPLNPCLMGGQYYPGKDKKRNLLRRKTLWYRIFCSSTIRMVMSITLCLYVIVGFVVMPTLDVIYDYGHWLSKGHYDINDKNHISVTNAVGHNNNIGDANTMNDTLQKDEGPMNLEAEEERQVMMKTRNNNNNDDKDDHDFEEEDDDRRKDQEEIKNSKTNTSNKNDNEEEIIQKHSSLDTTKLSSSIAHDISNNENHDSNNESNKNLIYQNIKSLEILKQDAKQLDENIEKMQNDVDRTKQKDEILKQIVPEFHDAATGTTVDGTSADTKKKGAIRDGNNNITNDNNQSNNNITTETINVIDNNGYYIERNLLNIRDHYTYSSCPRDGVHGVSISLVLQTTFDRLKLLRLICKRWKNAPIMISVYLTQQEYETEWNDAVKEYSMLCNNSTIFLPYISTSNEERTLRYPINLLRNKALDRVESSHVLVIDIDMIPSENLDLAILDSIALAIARREDDDGDASLDPLDAIVVPAFERKLTKGLKCDTLEECQELIIDEDEDFIPRNLDELKKNIIRDECVVFQSENNWEGHYSTNTNVWIESSFNPSANKELRVIECFESLRYEPYVVIPWCALKSNAVQLIMKRPGPRSPYYDERFYGYGKNKIQYIAHLRRKGYQFFVMPPVGFVTHFPHPISQTKTIWNDKKNFDLHNKMDRLYPAYLKELDDVYDNFFVRTELCSKNRK